MSLANLDGGLLVPIGAHQLFHPGTNPTLGSITLDAANEAAIFVGHIITDDGASHTIDTTGSSEIGWAALAVTFANAGTTLKVGLGAVDAANGPPARAANAAGVITFDVSKTLTGGGGGVATGWQTHVPDAGTKTIASGDLVAMAVQMTARAGADTLGVALSGSATFVNRPTVTSYVGVPAFTAIAGTPDAIIRFSDGHYGWFFGSDLAASISNRTFNSGSGTVEYGQLFKLPFPARIYGIFGDVDPDGDFDGILYSNPLGGTPVAERTASFDANTAATAQTRRMALMFSSPYDATADQQLGVVFKPGASNITLRYKTLAAAGHRVTDPWGVDGYGISRASGAFADANSSLDHYYVGLLIGGFEVGGAAGLVAPLFGGGIV